MPQPRILLSKRALSSNLENLIKLSGGLKAFPVLKANAYGLGLKEVSQILDVYSEDVLPYFCVARSIELQQLRNFGVRRKLLLLSEWPTDLSALPENCELMVASVEDLEKLAHHKKALSYHLKINSGMNRLGVGLSELASDEAKDRLVKLVKRAESQGQSCSGICTHLASGEEAPEKFSHKQLRPFQNLYEDLEKRLGKNFKWVHGLNSPGVLRK